MKLWEHKDDKPTSANVSPSSRPSADQIAEELKEHQRRDRLRRVMGSTISGMLAIAALVVLLATFVFPTLRIYGSSMVPTLNDGEVVVSIKSSNYETGDIIAFYYNNKIFVKRVICGPSEWFNMQEDGAVYVNGSRIEESYISEPGFGSCDIDLPFQVPADQYFVMGDQRMSSIDSRMEQMGCVPQDRIVGRIVMRVWPLDSLGIVP